MLSPAHFLLASADALTKRTLSSYAGPELTLLRFGYTGLVLSPLFVTFPFTSVPGEFWLWIAAAIPVELLANVLYMSAIRSAPLSVTLPYLAFTPVLVVLSSRVIVGETISLGGFAGISLVVAGAFWLNLEQPTEGGTRRWLDPLRAFARTRGSQQMLGAAALYAVTSAIGKHMLSYVSGVRFAGLYYGLLGLSALVLFGLTGLARPRVLFERPKWKVAAGLLLAGNILTHFEGLALVEVAYFIAVKRVSLLFGIAYGALLFGERGGVRHLLAGCVMVAGAALIVLAG